MIMQTHYLCDNCPGGHVDEHFILITLRERGMDSERAVSLVRRLMGYNLELEEPEYIKEYYNTEYYNCFIEPIQQID